jgi:hypothetical protein
MTSEVDRIAFLDVERGVPDRGWGPNEVMSELATCGVVYDYTLLSSPSELLQLIGKNSRCLYWPLDFTFDKNPASNSLLKMLSDLDCPYIGCNPSGARSTSKIEFRDAMAGACIPVAQAVALYDQVQPGDQYNLPAYIKAEYSCDSAGVRRATTRTELVTAVADLRRFDQRLFVEAEIPGREWTIGCIVVAGRLISAALQFEPLYSDFIDSYAKSHNDAIRFTVPSAVNHSYLRRFAARIVSGLGLTGYFRIDVMGEPPDGLRAIDLNVLPYLNSDPEHLSYLPMTFIRGEGCAYRDVIGAVIASAESESVRLAPQSPLHRLAMQSSLTSDARLRIAHPIA